MEATAKRGCSFPPSGTLTYHDEYGVIYEVSWETTRSGLDVTTVTKDPRVPGQEASGYVVGHALFRRGTVTVDRDVIAADGDGYVIVASGGSQTVETFQSSFPCGPAAVDPFCYHLNNAITDDIDMPAACGPRWTDPEDDDDDVVSWGEVAATDGEVSQLTMQLFMWINVWGQDDELQSTCP